MNKSRENVSDAEESEHVEQHVAGTIKGQIQPASEEVMRASAQHRIAFNPGTVERIVQIVGKSRSHSISGAWRSVIERGKAVRGFDDLFLSLS